MQFEWRYTTARSNSLSHAITDLFEPRATQLLAALLLTVKRDISRGRGILNHARNLECTLPHLLHSIHEQLIESPYTSTLFRYCGRQSLQQWVSSCFSAEILVIDPAEGNISFWILTCPCLQWSFNSHCNIALSWALIASSYYVTLSMILSSTREHPTSPRLDYYQPWCYDMAMMSSDWRLLRWWHAVISWLWWHDIHCVMWYDLMGYVLPVCVFSALAFMSSLY